MFLIPVFQAVGCSMIWESCKDFGGFQFEKKQQNTESKRKYETMF